MRDIHLAVFLTTILAMTPRAAVVVHCRRSYHEAKDGDGDIKDGAETKMLDCRGGFFRRDFSYACVNTSLHIT